jgi:hypothetical protein
MKYYTHLYNYKEGNERLNKIMDNCVYFRKNLYYDANFAATNFVLLDKTGVSIRLNYEMRIFLKINSNFPMRSYAHTC